MSITESLRQRRSYYNIEKTLPADPQEVVRLVEDCTELVPDAFNMKSSRVAVVTGEKHQELWDKIEELFGGKVPAEKINGFRSGFGTILYFYDGAVVKGLQDRFPAYAHNFPVWADMV